MKFLGLLVLGILIGCAAAGGYAYPLLQAARQQVTAAEASRDALGKTVKEQEEQLKVALAARSSLEAESKAQLGQLQSALKETKDQLGQIQASLKESKEELARAQSAREAAEAALALAKKEAPQGASGH